MAKESHQLTVSLKAANKTNIDHEQNIEKMLQQRMETKKKTEVNLVNVEAKY